MDRRWLEVYPVNDHKRVAALSKEGKLKKIQKDMVPCTVNF